MHTLTLIPPGSSVTIWIFGRHPQGKKVINTGAMQVRATEISYPMKISVRPGHLAPAVPGQMRNFGKMNPMNGEETAKLTTGHDIDFWILSPDEFCDGTEPKFLKSRMNRADAEVIQVQTASSPATDIYGRIFCTRCHRQIDSGGLCEKCASSIEGIDLCTAPDRRETGLYECKSTRHPGLKVCTKHAEETGLIAPATPPADRCVWSGCPASRYKQYFMCAEHAIESGLVGSANSNGPLRVVGAVDPVPEKAPRVITRPMGANSHKPECICRPCSKRRRDTAEIVAAHDSVESITPLEDVEDHTVLSGVDVGEGGL